MLYPEVAERIATLALRTDSDVFANRLIGLEKESLRVNAEGGIAQTDHPEPFGKALCNPTITTDFSEALLEMVTPPTPSASAAHDYLTSIHHHVVRHLPDDEMLWNTSMPCILTGESSIRIAEYGQSFNGRMKNIYRRGLGLRYGRKMQAIAGIHFNFSMPESLWPYWADWRVEEQCPPGVSSFGESAALDDATAGYFHMSRNLLRIGWLVPYLFGSSPAVCRSFLDGDDIGGLSVFKDTTVYEPQGTSLRQGNIGYSYREDDSIDLSVRHDCFRTYLDDLLAHISCEHPAYAKLGVKDVHGRYRQLNAKRLQIENEYYSSVRPKQIPERGEMPLLAMQKRGIQYIELRSMDVSPFHDSGVDLESLHFLELMMMFSALADSPALACSEMSMNGANMLSVAHRGRESGLMLETPAGPRSFAAWSADVLKSMEPIADYLDTRSKQNLYRTSLKAQQAKLNDSALTPSAKVQDEIEKAGSFFSFAMGRSQNARKNLLASPGNATLQKKIEQNVEDSNATYAALGNDPSDEDFDAFLENYFSQIDGLGA